MKGQASMIDVLLLGLFVSIVLIGGTFFVGGEQLRAQQGRSDSIYAQTQLITLLNYRNASWNNATAAAVIDDAMCNVNIIINRTPDCSYDYNNADETFYWTLQNTLNLTNRENYNYIFRPISNRQNPDGTQVNFTICNKQVSVCQKNIQPAITRHVLSCTDSEGNRVTVDYALGIWPAWQELPATC